MYTLPKVILTLGLYIEKFYCDISCIMVSYETFRIFLMLLCFVSMAALEKQLTTRKYANKDIAYF